MNRKVLLALGCLAGSTAAQFTGAANAPADSNRIEQTIIYGSRTANTLEDTLGSVGVVSLEEIRDMDLRSFREAFRTLGNVMDGDWVDSGFVIRGVNSEGLTPGGAPLASLYIDGAQQTVNGARRGARGLWDVKQVEVYRGPQSTLSGRASMAGAIYIKTNDPTFEWDGAARGILGTDELKNSALAVGGPLIDDQLAFRLAGEYEKSENGDIKYPTYEGYNHYDNFIEDEYYQVRGKLLYTPTWSADTRALLGYAHAKDSPNVRDIGGPQLGFDYDDPRGDFNLPVYAEVRDSKTDTTTLEVDHAFNTALRFTSMSSYSKNDTDRPSINEGTPGETEITRGDFVQELFTQELRMNYDEGAWRGVMGVYFADEQNDAGYTRTAFGRTDVSTSKSDSTNYALFGEASYSIVEDWRLIAGGRWDYTEQDDSTLFTRNGVVRTDDSPSFDEDVFLPKAGVAYDVDANQVIGFTVQKGFRSGGAGVQVSTGTTYQFDPEYTWNYELSYKGSLDGGRLSITSNVFYTDWKDQQVELQEDPLDFGSTVVDNAASSTSYGAEFETRYQFTPNLSGFASIGYVDTEFEDFKDASIGDLSGYPFPEAPEWNLALGGQYAFARGFYVGMDAKYLDDFQARFGTPPQEKLDSYWIANAQAGWKSEHWEISVFAENLFDETYFVYNDRDLIDDIAATLGYERRVGVSATYLF